MKMSEFNFDSVFFRRVISKCEKTLKIKSVSCLIKEAVETFYDEYDYYPDVAALAPGTFTIMGDHLEYVEGYLVQGALPMVTVVVGKSLDTVKCKVVTTSKDVQGLRKAVFPIATYKRNLKVFPEWVNFVKGVIGMFPCKSLKGFDAVINSNIPVCQGYGSSAGLQVAFYTFLEAACKKKACDNKINKALLCRLGEVNSHNNIDRIGQWCNFTSSVAEGNQAVFVNCRTDEASTFDLKDIEILFLLTYPNFNIERKDRDLIQTRKVELKLAAYFLGLEHIIDVTGKDLETLANMEDPSKETVINLLRRWDLDEEFIYKFVEDLFYFPRGESETEEGFLYYGENEYFGELDENGNVGESDLPESENKEITAEDDTRKEKVYRMPCLPLEMKKETWTSPAPPPSPVSYIHQRIAELCEGKTGSDSKLPVRICEEINCLGGIENLSQASDLSVMSKLVRRLRHVLTEKMRCFDLKDIIYRGDYVEFGSKIIQSHLSLKIDFDVSCATLDGLVQLAIETEDVYGAKMMSGGGVLTLLHRSVAEKFIDQIIEKFGNRFQFYLVFPSSGASILNLGVKSNPKSSLSTAYPNLAEVMKKAVANFKATYGYLPTHGSYSPGIVNLIGDHTDYNHGFNISVAVNLLIVVVGAFNGTSKIRVATTANVDEPQKVIFPLPVTTEVTPGNIKWAKLIKGVVFHFHGELSGFDCLIETNMAEIRGIESKAALLVSFYSFLEELTGQAIKKSGEKAYRCMLAQHEFIKTLSGMGEYSVATIAKEDYAVLFDCRNNSSTLIPFQDPSVVILMTFTDTEPKTDKALMYIRMEECHDVAKIFGKKSLRCFTAEDLKKINSSQIKETSLKRATHVLNENDRTLKAAEALKNSDYDSLGELMVASHNSLRDYFEISTPELDCLVKLSMEVDGVFGSKMPCTGYQNCIISLVKRWAVDDLIDYLQSNYCRSLTFYVVNPQNGCGPVNVKEYVDSLPTTEVVFEDIFPF